MCVCVYVSVFECLCVTTYLILVLGKTTLDYVNVLGGVGVVKLHSWGFIVVNKSNLQEVQAAL